MKRKIPYQCTTHLKLFREKVALTLLLFLIIILNGCNYVNNSSNVMEMNNPKVDFISTSNSFYFDQLDKKEKDVLSQISELMKDCKGGVIHLSEPINVFEYARIVRTLSVDETYRLWSFVAAYPIDDDGKLVDIYEANSENTITKMYIQAAEKEMREELTKFKLEYTDEKYVLNADELLVLLENNTLDTEYYDETCKRIENIISDVVEQLPEEVSEKEAVNYFCRWIKDNIDYNYNVLGTNLDPMYDHMMEMVTYANSAYEQCIIEGEAICSGFAIILSKLCNRVGIDSYVAFGTVTSEGITIGHAWVAVEISGNTYYVDPTYVCETGIIDGFHLKNEMIRGKSGRVYGFDELFNYF